MTLLEHDTRQHLRQLVSQARRNRALQLDLEAGTKHCAGCQTPTFTYTNGCRTCNDRRRKIRKAAAVREAHTKAGRCNGCGTHHNRYTLGCETCTTRRAKRRT